MKLGDSISRYGITFGIGLVLLLAAVAVRILEWPAWSASGAWLDGAPLLATNDGYAWLAGVSPEGRMHGWPLSRLIAFLSAVLPFSTAQVAFFLPAALAGLPALVVVCLAHARGQLAAALPAGILSACGMAFLLRTRLGYPETELFALPGALGLAVAWALALGLGRREPTGAIDWRWTMGACGWAALAVWAYPSAYPLLMAILPAGALGWFLAGGRCSSVLTAVAAVAVAMHWGPVGLVLSITLCLFAARSPLAARPAFSLGASGLAILASLLLANEPWMDAIRRLAIYAGWLPSEGDWSLPDVAASIRETTRDSAGEFFLRLAGHWAWVLAGLAGYGWLAFRRPEWLAFAPPLLLGLAGYWIGPRFAMYATPVIGLGLGFGLATWLSGRGWQPHWQWLAQVVLAACLLATTVWYARALEPNPVIAPDHARALQQLASETSGNARLPARVWEWWDLGYAAQHFARLPSFSDGATTSRRHAYMLGRVLGAETPADAAAWMRLGAQERLAINDSNNEATPGAYAHRPLSSVDELAASDAKRALGEQIARLRGASAASRSDEYLVVSWHALRRAEWISRFARWDLVSGEAGQGQSRILAPPVQFDEHRGRLQTPNGIIRLASMTLLQDGQRYHWEWPEHRNGQHAVINNDLGEGVLLDTDLYSMMAVQMLLHSPTAFQAAFELVVDHSPHARVYRLR